MNRLKRTYPLLQAIRLRDQSGRFICRRWESTKSIPKIEIDVEPLANETKETAAFGTVKTLHNEDNDLPVVQDVSRDTRYAAAGMISEVPPFSYGAITPPIYVSTTYARDSNLELEGFSYSRLGNPTRRHLEKTFAQLESGIEGFAFSSGMQCAFAILSSCPNSHVLLPDDLYRGVQDLLTEVFAKWGTTHERLDMSDHKKLKERLADCAKTSDRRVLLWLETPSNPTCQIADVEKIAALAKETVDEDRLLVVVDSTFATPYLLNPLTMGADLVVHSMTKYVGGHSDLLGGMVVAANTVGANIILSALRSVHQIGGGVCGPFEAWLAIRGLRTLPVRMRQHSENAMALAEFLEGHPRVDTVHYPGLLSHPQHALAEAQMGGRYGGMLSFQVKSKDPSSAEEALQVLKRVKLFRRATSLGGTESMIQHHATEETGAAQSSPPNLLRVSAGLEDIGDLLADLDVALRDD